MKTVLIGLALFSLVGCGKTLDQIRQTAHSLIDVGGKVYEDAKDNALTTKDAMRDIVNPSGQK